MAALDRRRARWLAAAGGGLSLLLPAMALATTTLTVDLSKTYRPATHVGNGSLYGVIEQKPAALDTLVKPLHPNMFTNPASSDPGTQQPGVPANAIKVATRLAPYGARVTIRLADWFSGWYSFSSMTDWFDKMGKTVAAKQAANLTNVYAYEIWNEPNGTWKSDKPLSFNDFWKQSYDKLRQLDPSEKITGPSLAGYDATVMESFISYCKTNNCLPDIVGWHEGEYITNNINTYRALEKKYGVGPLPITMNEYSGSGQIKDEGRPGASAPLIAQLERSGVDAACITWWDTSKPGHLGSLLATDTETNGGWFFYKWYGEMTGNMVQTTSSLSVTGKNLDGVASLDPTAQNVSVILGGVNDGTVQIVVKGLSAAPFFGSKVHAVVERTPWTSISTVVAKTETLQATDLAVSNDQLSVSITGTNENDGYHLGLSPVGGGASGGGGTGGGGGAVGGDGSLGGGGSAGTDGAASRDATGTGGTDAASSTGGNTGGRSGSGGVGGTDGGADARGGTAVGGATGTGGGATTVGGGGGVSSSGGTSGSSGGTGGGTGRSAAGGSGGAWPGSGGATASGGGRTDVAGTNATGGVPSGGTRGEGKSSGCSCQTGRTSGSPLAAGLLLLALGTCRRSRRGGYRRGP